ncbi:auxin efflux carrier transmembrane protein [Mycena floridula]|nr:auxin efflux carrier transmembrane protein [Mycena floridula]
MVDIGVLIWISVRPLLRLVFTVACGLAVTLADIFPPVAAVGAGQIMLNVALPCLMFSKIVPAFDSDNVKALGPLVLISLIYGFMGIAIAWFISQFFWVPHRFRKGILAAGGFSNVADIPTSVIMSITAAAPFGGTSDQNLAVAYISAILLVYMVTFFPCGGHRWIAADFVGPDVEPEEIREQVRLRRRMILYGWTKRFLRLYRFQPGTDIEVVKNEKAEPVRPAVKPLHQRTRAGKHVPFYDDAMLSGAQSPVCSPPPSTDRGRSPEPTLTALSPPSSQAAETSLLPIAEKASSLRSTTSTSQSQLGPIKYIRLVLAHLKSGALQMMTPPSLSILISFPIALIPKVKALFVKVDGVSMPSAPDGLPPLAFFLDTTTFIGAASVPLGLICLGSALARMKISRNNWTSLPLGAIASLAIGKMILSPVLGVLITKGFVHVGLISQDDRVLQFVCIFFSCLPTATTQVYITQVYSGTGSAEHLPPFLIPQYFLMFFSMTILNAYTLNALF